MATNIDYVEYVCDQLHEAGQVRYRKMFGEYMVYIDDKPIVLVCDNTPFIKITEHTEPLMQGSSTGYPYPGAKLHYLLDIDNISLHLPAILKLKEVTSVPKPKKRKS
ncbi:MAG: TfoX/Sxy family protein [Rikenellaceae bacterium]|nr:TfoX/Sxy family protein [Rikenellaceae bacterium]